MSNNILSEDLEGATTGSSINAPGAVKALTLSKILEDIEKFFGDNPDFKKGTSKSSKPKFNLVDYLKNYNLIVYDHLIKNNRDIASDQKFLIKTYFDAMLKSYDVLGCVDLTVAEVDLLSYTTGYNLQTLRKFYDRYQKVQESKS